MRALERLDVPVREDVGLQLPGPVELLPAVSLGAQPVSGAVLTHHTGEATCTKIILIRGGRGAKTLLSMTNEYEKQSLT